MSALPQMLARQDFVFTAYLAATSAGKKTALLGHAAPVYGQMFLYSDL